jgi:hypothetical protein
MEDISTLRKWLKSCLTRLTDKDLQARHPQPPPPAQPSRPSLAGHGVGWILTADASAQKSALTSGRQLVDHWPSSLLATLVKDLLLGYSTHEMVARRGRLQLLCHATGHGHVALEPVLPFLLQGLCTARNPVQPLGCPSLFV